METTDKKDKTADVKAAGVVMTIVNAVETAGEEGITRAKIFAQLKKKFPDRDHAKMERTVKLHVPGLITKERFKVIKVEGTDKYRKEDLNAASKRPSDARYGKAVATA